MTTIIHVHTGAADKFYVNSFLLETSRAVVLVDTQFVVSEARALRRRLDRIGKPLAGVVITHPHPDHFNGLPIVLDGLGPVPTYATRRTINVIAATRAAKRDIWAPIYGEDYPSVDALPDHEVGSDGVIALGGVELRLIDLGGGESADNNVLHVASSNALIASDLIYNNCHPWLAEQRTAAWLRQLDTIEAKFQGVSQVFAGHGPPGAIELFDKQRHYIRDFRRRVGERSRTGRLDDDALVKIVAETKSGRDLWPLEGLIELNARAVAEELAAA